MELDLSNAYFDTKDIKPREIEEALEAGDVGEIADVGGPSLGLPAAAVEGEDDPLTGSDLEA